jgi:hypothetical protein
MKRKLIKYDAFRHIENDSLSAAEVELAEAQEVLSTALGVDGLNLHCFGETDVTYETPDGEFVHASYSLSKDNLVFENIEQLVIDDESERGEARKILTDLVESLFEENEGKAAGLFDRYMALPHTRKNLKEATMSEGKFAFGKSNPSGKKAWNKGKKEDPATTKKRIKSGLFTKSHMSDSEKKSHKKASEAFKKGTGGNPRARLYARKVKKSKVNEWNTLSENVLQYVKFQQLGGVLRETKLRHDEKGNVVAVAVPTAQVRNEGKLLSFNWKVLDHEIKYSRNGAKNIQNEAAFARAISDLKRYNAISDNAGLETTLENIVAAWPQLLYLTHQELSERIAQALDTAGVQKYDDQMCDFMAEGILRMAHHAYTDRADKIVKISRMKGEGDDAYSAFRSVADKFLPQVDEAENAQYRVFADLYKALNEFYEVVQKEGDEATKQEVFAYMKDCESVLNRQDEPDLDLAENIATFLQSLVETNIDGEEWNVSNSTHISINGDHPRMAQLASWGYTPSKDFSGDWGSEMPVSDGKNPRNAAEVEKMKNSWANIGGSDTAPELKNPYVPQPFGDYKIKGEKFVGDDDATGEWGSKDTWPGLQNPYVPDSVRPPMKSDNLVQDK